jgi:tryptophan-rich sensory protein
MEEPPLRVSVQQKSRFLLCLQFFKAHNLQVAAWDLAALLATLVPTIRSFAKYDSVAAGLMVPYALFSVFATALNLKILNLNGPKPEF